MTVRFLVPDSGIRTIKSKMSCDIIEQFDRANISIASGTYEIVGMPAIKVHLATPDGNDSRQPSPLKSDAAAVASGSSLPSPASR